MSSRLKSNDNSFKNKTHISKASVCIKTQVRKYLKEKGRDSSVPSISIIVAKVAQKAPLPMLYDINNNHKTQ